MDVMICVPPEAPMTNRRLSFLAWVMMSGAIDDRGRLPGWMKLAGDAGKPKKLVVPGVEKSSISLLKRIPVRLPTIPEAKLKRKH